MEYIPATTISPEIPAAIRQAFTDTMDEEYSLIHTGDEDNYNRSGKFIQKCMDTKSDESLYEAHWEWEYAARRAGSEYVLEDLQNRLLCDNRYERLHPHIEDWLEENRNEMLEAIEERDTSNPCKEMAGRSTIRGRVTLHTNYDCLAHNYDKNNTYRYSEYFKDITDLLCLNPRKVKETFNRRGIYTAGRWPDKAKRTGKESVSYESLADEMQNQCCYGLLTFMGMLPLAGLYENNFGEYKTIVVPKGNHCGMFNSWNGGGSLMEMELIRDLYIPAGFPRKTEYDRSELCVDEPGCGNGYCIDEVYGLIPSAWGKEFRLIYKR